MDNQRELNTKSEANLYIELGLLLQKPRNPDSSFQVQQVLRTDLGLEEKIQRIQLIDKEAIPADTKSNEGLKDTELLRLIRRKGLVTEDEAKKNRQGLVTTFYRPGFFSFLLHEYRLLKKFENDTKAISASIIPPKVTISRWMRKMSLPALQKDANSILPFLHFVLEVGWIILNKLDYNLIAHFKSLCEEILTVGLIFDKDEKQMQEKFRKLHQLFLVCHYRDDYPDMVISGISSVLKIYNRPPDKIENALYTARRILLPGTSASLYNLVLAVNMVVYRRHFDIKHLIPKLSLGVVNTFDYECEDKIRDKINVFVGKNERKLKEYVRHKQELEDTQHFIRNFLQRDDGEIENYDLTLLAMFYESGYGSEKFKYHRDKDDIAVFAINFFTRFLKEFEPFLGDKIELEDWGMLVVFSPDFFQLELNKLHLLLNQLSKDMFKCPHFSRDRFVHIKLALGNVSPTPEESIIIHMITDLSNLIVDLGKKVGQLSMSLQPDLKQITRPQEEFKSIDSSNLLTPIFSVPFFHKKIRSTGFLRDKTFEQALFDLATLCFLGGMFFQNESLSSLMEKVMETNDVIKKIKDNLERICDIGTYEQIRRLYGI